MFWDLVNPVTWVKVGADAVGYTVKQTGKIVGEVAHTIGGEEAKQHIVNGFNTVGEAVRTNPVTDGINKLNEAIGLRTKFHPMAENLIKFIDAAHDIPHSSITHDAFKEKCANINELLFYCAIASIPYVNYTLSNGEPLTLQKIKDVNPYIREEDISRFFSGYTILKSTKEYIVCTLNSNQKDVLLLFRGTVDEKDVIHDLCIGDLVGGYHEQMIVNAVQYATEDNEYLLNVLTDANKITLCGHSLGAGISVYMLLLLYQRGITQKIDVQCICFSCPAVLPRALRKKMSTYILSIIDDNDCVPKYYKNMDVCHPCEMMHLSKHNPGHAEYGQFNVDFMRFIPNIGIQIYKMVNDAQNVDCHYLSNLYTLLFSLRAK